jgi:nucleoside 2-deoxyribosyltransferase
VKIYLAGPLFTLAERMFNARLAELLRAKGHTVFNPQQEEPREFTTRGIFSMDLNDIHDSDVVVANMDGADPDSGTAWEVAAFYIGGKQVLQYRTDFRGVGEANLCGYNIMLWESADIRILHSCLDPKNTIEVLADLIHDKLTHQHAS